VPAELASILRIEVPVIVQIAARRMTMREVANLSPGAIIELPKLATEELEILVSNRPIGMGAAVKVGENFGVRINYVGDLRDRIRALGPPRTGGEAPAPAAAPSLGEPEADEASIHPPVAAAGA
jgi:flagellar motor switch protein FliN